MLLAELACEEVTRRPKHRRPQLVTCLSSSEIMYRLHHTVPMRATRLPWPTPRDVADDNWILLRAPRSQSKLAAVKECMR